MGFLYGYIENSGDCYIDKKAILDAMYVDSDYRKKGVGKTLIEEFEKWAKNKEVKYIELKVCNSNKCAFSLYSKKGYENIKSIMIRTLEK